MAATKLAVTTQPGTIPAGAGASYPYTTMVVSAQDAGSVLDTTYGQTATGFPADLTQPYATATLTTPGGAVLSGSDKVAFLAGTATFYGLAVSAPGTYTYTIASSTGLTGTTSGSFTVSAAVDTFYNPDNRLRGLGAALPRTVPTSTPPVQAGTIRYVGPTDTYTTIQAAYNAASYGDSIVLRDGQTLSETVTFTPKVWVAGYIVIRSETEPTPVGERTKPADWTTQAIWQPPNTANAPVFLGPSGASHIWLQSLHLRSNPAVLGSSALCLLGFDDGDPLAINAAGIPDALNLDRCYLHHDDPSTAHYCQRAVRWRSKNTAVINCYFKGFQSTGGGDSQSLFVDNTPGNMLLDNNYIEGEAEGFIIGGTDFIGPDLVPTDVTITRNYWTKPSAYIVGPPTWQTKNLLELKAGHRIRVEGNIFDGFWDSGVSQWSALNVKSVNQIISASNAYVGASDVVIRHNFVRNVPDLMTCHGGPQGPVEILSRVVVHNLLCANINSTTWSNGTNGDGLLAHFASFNDTVFDHITFVSAPKANLLRTLILGDFSSPTRHATVANLLIQTDLGAGLIVSGASATPTMNGIITTIDPDAVFATNYYGGMDPAWNAYNVANSPAGNLFVNFDGSANAPDPGFTNYAIRTTALSADPLLICAAFVLASGVCKGGGTGGSDIGVKDMPALITAITGVMLGVYGAAAVIPPADTVTPVRVPSLTLPSPAARYSQKDQRETRRQIEQAFQRLAAQQPLQPITGSVAGNVALANLLTALADTLIKDATS